MQTPLNASEENLERLNGIVERVTFHNPENGWTVLKVSSFRDPGRMITVLIHQVKVFAGSTMEFLGSYNYHPKYGEQFKAVRAVEKKPASAAALEKYLGSGLIRGVGPATAKRIVGHFKDRTLEVFEDDIDELMRVPGIAEKKLEQIKTSWAEHRAIRDVMIFLQGYGISTLFATKIYKTYGDQAIRIVSENPYRLAHDIYGIGFFSADKIALAMGFERTGELRIEAGIKHVLAGSRDEGHCYLTEAQIFSGSVELLREKIEIERIQGVLNKLHHTDQIKKRRLPSIGEVSSDCHYSKGLYFDEMTTAHLIRHFLASKTTIDPQRIDAWVSRYCEKHEIKLSDEQRAAVSEIPKYSFSILTGGPGCGKTTCTKVLVALLKAMKKEVILAAPTGRAAQRMTEVIGFESKTIHRLLEWAPDKGGFKKTEENPLSVDFLIVDETSMLDISLASSLLKAVPSEAQILFIGDPDQLPAVGAGDVLADLLRAENVPRFRLTKVFRQAQASSIIRFAHEINAGQIPKIISPLAHSKAFTEGHDCLFVDADEATQDQITFLRRTKFAIEKTLDQNEKHLLKSGDAWIGRLQKTSSGLEVDSLYRPENVNEQSVRESVLVIPEKFKHVDLVKLAQAEKEHLELMEILKSFHPWSSLHYGLSAAQTVIRLYTKTIPEWFGGRAEIQVLTPQVRGSVGSLSLNEALQAANNPEAPGKCQVQFGGRILREGDRVIQTRNNYDLGVFNGDIGVITKVDAEEVGCEVLFGGGDQRRIQYEKDNLGELSLAYAVTIHKSQGSEFQVVIIPVLGQHFNMLFRNLIYTGLTRAKKLAIFVGSRKAFAMAVGQIDNRQRQTALTELLSKSP
ncbi:MAG: AAA family ATPase [Bdellovibrionales bacterium]|nr:AAA family ATPase [Bdellovibrionales bacterium]